MARVMSWTQRLLATAAGFITIRLIIERIGPHGYGQVAIALAALAGVAGVDLGLTQALARFVALYESRLRGLRRQVFWTSLLILVGLLFVFQTVLFTGVALAYERFHELEGLGSGEFLLLGLVLVAGTALSISAAVFAGFQLYGPNAAGKIGKSLLYVVAVIYLWYTFDLTVRSALWANVVAIFAANAVMCAMCFAKLGSQMSFTCRGFPRLHRRFVRPIAEYSVRGWTFALSTILLSFASVVVAGFLEPPAVVASLQIALTLFAGITAFITGGMAPMATIVARWGGADLESRQKIAVAARGLLTETVHMTAAIVVGVIHFGRPAIELVVGSQAQNQALIDDTYWMAVLVNVLGIGVMPFFMYRFALVDKAANARYSNSAFVFSVLALAAGTLVSLIFSGLTAMAAAVGAALAYRGIKAYRMGWQVLPDPASTPARILLSLAKALMLYEVLALAVLALRFLAEIPGIVQVGVYVGLSFVAYLLRRRLRRLVRPS
jgi:O-antigen/teichoic acid export membrane protein